MKHSLKTYTTSSLPVLPQTKVSWKLKKKVSLQNISDFGHELALLINTGIPVSKALEMIALNHEKPEMKTIIVDLKRQIESGKSLTHALKKYPAFFNPLFIQLILVGEQTGSLSSQLNQAATYLEKFLTLKNKLIKALSYPAFVLFFSVFIMIGILTLIIPQFQNLFQSLGGELPLLTRFIIKASNHLNYIVLPLSVFLIISLTIVFKLQKHSPRFAFHMDQFLLKTPKLGQLITHHLTARICYLLSVTHESGIPFPAALNLLTQSIKNRVFSQGLRRTQIKIQNGSMLHTAFANTNFLPKRAIQMIYMGEQSGALRDMLEKLGNYYEKLVEQQLEQVSKFLEPIMIVILGIGIGILIIAMYLPIFKLGHLF